MTTPAPKTNKFDAIVILATMRTGSNLLERIMIQHPQIVAAGELFNPHFIGSLAYMEARENPYFSQWSVQKRDQNPKAFLAELRQVFETKIPVFRFFPEHDPGALNAILDDERIAKVILKRNPLDSFVSLEISYATNQWLLNRRTKMDPNPKFEFDRSRYENWVTDTENFYATINDGLEKRGQKSFEIHYEHIKDLDSLDALCEFLGLRSGFDYFFEPLDRQNKKPIRDYLSNPEILDDIPTPRKEEPKLRPHAPVVPIGYLANRLKLIYLPIAGTNQVSEQEMLKAANGEALIEIPTKDIAKYLSEYPDHTAYTRVIDPRWRAYQLFLDHLLGATNGFDRSFAEIWAKDWQLPELTQPAELTKTAFTSAGLNPNIIKKALRAFIIAVRKELWSGHRLGLLSDQYWPQAMIIDNLRQNFPLEVIVEDGRDKRPALQALESIASPQNEYLVAPYDARKLIQHRLDQQLHDLYREDYEVFGFELDQSKLKP